MGVSGGAGTAVDAKGGRAALRGHLPLAVLLLAAVLVYRPWLTAPFSILDFSEFLPILREGGSFGERLAGLVRYFAGHGRSAWVTYAWISLNWSLFGDWSAGWDGMRFALMSGVVALAFAFLRRAGCPPFAAAAGAALLVVATPAQEGWTRLTGEPLGLAALLGAALLALGYQEAPRWAGRAISMALLLGAAVLAKEVLVVCAAPVLALALFRRGGGVGWPETSRRNLVLAGAAAAVLAGAAAVVLSTFGATPAEGYAQSYGDGGMNLLRYKAHLRLIGLPLSRTLPDAARVAALLLVTVMAAGWAAHLWDRGRRGSRAAVLLAALSVPVLGALVYLPWPRMERFYAFPFLAGPVVLLAVAVAALARRTHPARVLLPVAAALVLAGFDAAAHADESRAVRQVNAAVAREIGGLRGTDSVYVAVPGHVMPAQAWQGHGPTLRRYAVATGLASGPAPAVADVRCEEGIGRWTGAARPAAVVSFAHLCGPLPGATVVIERAHGYVDLLGMRRREKTRRADVGLPRTVVAGAAR
ncbi:MAG TPA: hypothetical protein VFR81_17575 [Longimicrobium sp.]|nr:hypothetical protein [Longimicrobium sp.]